MFRYTIELPIDIEKCECCPFTRQTLVEEMLCSADKLNGAVSMTRLETICGIKGNKVTSKDYRHYVNCPLVKKVMD